VHGQESQWQWAPQTPGRQLRSGRVFVVVGSFMALLGFLLLLVPLANLLPVMLGQVQLVPYAQYMLEAQLVAHGAFSVFFFVPAVLLIHVGRKRMRSGADRQRSSQPEAAP
jgi:hypothetical protein